MKTLLVKFSASQGHVSISLNDTCLSFRCSDLSNNIHLLLSLAKNFIPNFDFENNTSTEANELRLVLSNLSSLEDVLSNSDFTITYLIDPESSDCRITMNGEINFNIMSYANTLTTLLKNL